MSGFWQSGFWSVGFWAVGFWGDAGMPPVIPEADFIVFAERTAQSVLISPSTYVVSTQLLAIEVVV